MAGTKKRTNTKKSSAKKKAGFSPPELKLSTRFLASAFGKIVTAVALLTILFVIEIMIAKHNLHLLLLMTGITLLLVMAAFWLYLLLKRAVRLDA